MFWVWGFRVLGVPLKESMGVAIRVPTRATIGFRV